MRFSTWNGRYPTHSENAGQQLRSLALDGIVLRTSYPQVRKG